MKLLEFLPTTYSEVVLWLLCPVFLFRIVKPLDEVQNAAPFPGTPKDLFNIVFLALFDVIGFP